MHFSCAIEFALKPDTPNKNGVVIYHNAVLLIAAHAAHTQAPGAP
jgi:hypothetical protein